MPNAPTISYTFTSGVPKAIEGTSGISPVIPMFFAIKATGLGPTLSINCAVTVFTEPAKAFFKVMFFKVYLPSEFFGHHASGLPCLPASIQYSSS